MSDLKPTIPDHLLAYRLWFNTTSSEVQPLCVLCSTLPTLWSVEKCEHCASATELLTEIDVLGWHVENFPAPK